MTFCDFSCCKSCLLSYGIHVFHLCVYFRWSPILVFPPDAKYCIYIHDFRRRWPSVYFHWSVIQFQFGAIFYMHIFFNFHYTLELVIIYNPLCYNFMFGCLCICTRSNNRNWIKKDEKTPFCVTILGRCFNGMSFPGC